MLGINSFSILEEMAFRLFPESFNVFIIVVNSNGVIGFRKHEFVVGWMKEVGSHSVSGIVEFMVIPIFVKK